MRLLRDERFGEPWIGFTRTELIGRLALSGQVVDEHLAVLLGDGRVVAEAGSWSGLTYYRAAKR